MSRRRTDTPNIGNKYGRLTVIKPYGYKDWSNRKLFSWVCKCECGTEVVVKEINLKRGLTRSCGCLLPPQMTPKNDLSGKRFGLLTVLYLTKTGRYSEWVCKCDCGNIRNVPRTYLTKKQWPTRHCGCKNRESDSYIQICKYLLRQYKAHRSKERGFLFELTLDDFLSLCFKPCYYCGKIYSRSCKVLGRVYTADANGLDRINNEEGYCLNNVVTSCVLCNMAKGTRNRDEFLEWINAVYDYQHIQNGGF